MNVRVPLSKERLSLISHWQFNDECRQKITQLKELEVMSTPEEKLEKAAATITTEISKVKAWYASYPFYCGIALGVVVTLIVRHLF